MVASLQGPGLSQGYTYSWTSIGQISVDPLSAQVTALAPSAATRFTEPPLPPALLDALKPAAVVPAMLVLASEPAPTRTLVGAGAGSVEAAHITLTQGRWIGVGADAPEMLAAQLAEVTARDGESVPRDGSAQGRQEIERAMARLVRA